MGGLLKFALAVAEQAVSQRGRQVVERTASVAVFAIAAAACGAAALACALAALWIYSAARVGPVAAPLIVAGVLLVLCLVMLVVMRYTLKPKPRSPAVVSPLAPAVLLAEANRQFKDHKSSMLLAAVIAGLAVGVNER